MKKMKKDVRKSVYVGAVLDKNNCYIAVVDHGGVSIDRLTLKTKEDIAKILTKWVSSYTKDNYVKIIAFGLSDPKDTLGHEGQQILFSYLWLKEDIMPFEFKAPKTISSKTALVIAKKTAGEFETERVIDVKLGEGRDVEVHPLVRMQDYEKFSGKRKVKHLINLSRKLKDRNENIAFFSSTSRGGGVALMRHSIIRIAKLLGVDITWYVMSSDEKVFNITKKKFHNILQGVAQPEDKLTHKDKKIYNAWIKKNARDFEPVFRRANTIIIDDPQPSGMIPYIKKVNPKAKIIYRSHIQIDVKLLRQGVKLQEKTWEFLWPNIKLADVFVSHPIRKFVPPVVDKDRVVWMPATTDELDGLNKPLNKQQLTYYYGVLNKYLEEHNQTPLDLSRPYIAQIARFDPSKGIPDVVVAYRTLRDMLKKNGYDSKKLPQLVIAGHGSVDDPEGSTIFDETLNRMRMDVNQEYAQDIKIARLEHCDQLLNAILSGCKVVLQLSYKEGFEVKVSEALAKGKPVVAYKTGGIILQIENGDTGYLVSTGKTHQVARHLYNLFTNEKLYSQISNNAKNKVKKEIFSVENAIRWMDLILQLHAGTFSSFDVKLKQKKLSN